MANTFNHNDKVVITDSGSVGIGTTSPADKLHVSISSGNYQIGGDSSGNIYHKSQSGEHRFRADGGTTNAFTIANNLISTLKTAYFSGNVGIGTTSPSQKLQVDGSLLVNAGTSVASYRDIMMGGINGWITGESHGIDTVYGTAGNPTTFSRIESYFDGSNGKIRFRNLYNASAPRTDILMTIAGSGNVGIGTDSPSQKLHVEGGAVRVTGGTSNGKYADIYVNDSWAYFTTNLGKYYLNAELRVDTGLIGSYNEDLQLRTSGSTRITISNTSGNVGIGTTSPTNKLNILVGDGGSNGVAGLRIGGTNNYDSLELGIYGAYGGMVRSYGNDLHYFAGHWKTIGSEATENHSHYWYTSKNGSADWSTPKMELDHDGNLGIGTTSPTQKLDVVGTIRVHDGVDNGRILFRGDRTDVYIQELSYGLLFGAPSGLFFEVDTNNNGYAVFNVTRQGSSSFYINDSQNVGIGTTSPSYKLDVAGSARISLTTDTRLVINQDTAGTNFGLQLGYQGTRNWDIYNNGAADSKLFFFSEQLGASAVTFTPSGNVGIGTTSPIAKLDVAGEIRSTGGFTSDDGNFTRILNPGGATYSSGSTTGTIKITLPLSWTNTMMRIVVKVFDYANSEGFTVELGGYNYTGTGSGGYWANTYAYITSSPIVDRNFNVRFGHDGTNCCIYIGETTQYWAYLKVAVTEAQFGHSGFESYRWNDGWDIRETSSLGTISSTQSSTQISNWARSGQNLYYGSGTGNVGIGTTSPGAKLDVIATANQSSGVIQAKSNYASSSYFSAFRSAPSDGSTTLNGGLWMGAISDDNATISSGAIYRSAGQWRPAGTTASVISIASGKITFNTNSGLTANTDFIPSARLTIASDGNVGIGTTSPSKVLHVVGDTLIEASGSGQTLLLERAAGKPTIKAGTSEGGNLVLDSNTGHIYLNNYVNKNVFIATGGGSVGIGTTSPVANLHINSSTTESVLQLTTSTSGALISDGLRIAMIGNVAAFLLRESADMWFATSNTERLRITSAGNVGIGTTSPGEKLHVVGNARIGTETQLRHAALNVSAGYGAATTYRDIDIKGSWAGGEGHSITATHGSSVSNIVGQIVFQHDGPGSRIKWGRLYHSGDQTTYPMHLVSDGGSARLGIGTDSPAYTLDVSGGAIAIRGNAAGNSLRFDDSSGTSRNAMYLDTSNYLNVGNANYTGIKLYHTATAPSANGLEGNQIAEGYGTTENGKVLAEPDAWLAVRIGTTDYAIPMYTAG